MQRVFLIFLLTFFILVSLLNCYHAEAAMETVFKDAFYGGLVGTLVGGALLLFQDNPGDNLEYLAYGTGSGIILGAIYGFATVSRSLVEIEKNKIYVNFPSIHTEIYSENPWRKEVIHSFSLINYNF